MLKILTIDYNAFKKIILIFLVLLMINYSFNTIFNFAYLLPTNLAGAVIFYILMHALFPQKFQFFKEDVLMMSIILYCLVHSLFLGTYEDSLLVVGMSLVPYFLSRYIILEDNDIDFLVKSFCIFGIILLGVYFNYVGFSPAEGGVVSINKREPVGIAADFGIVAIAFAYVLFTTKKKWVKLATFCLLAATFYMTTFMLARRGASFGALTTIIFLYFLLGEDTLKGKLKKLLLILVFLSIFFLIINNETIIETYPVLKRFQLKYILHDPGVVGGNRRYRGRKDLFIESFNIILRSPFFGEGIFVVYSHNIFLEWIASLGFIGLFPFLFFLFFVFTKALKLKKLNPRFSLIFSMLLYSFVLRLTSFSIVAHKTFFILCGLLLSYYYTYYKKFILQKNE